MLEVVFQRKVFGRLVAADYATHGAKRLIEVIVQLIQLDIDAQQFGVDLRALAEDGGTLDGSLLDATVFADVLRLHDAAYRAYQRSIRLDEARREIDTRDIRERVARQRVDLLVEAKAAVDGVTQTLDHAQALAVEREGEARQDLSAARSQLDRSLKLAKDIETRLASFDTEFRTDPLAHHAIPTR